MKNYYELDNEVKERIESCIKNNNTKDENYIIDQIQMIILAMKATFLDWTICQDIFNILYK